MIIIINNYIKAGYVGRNSLSQITLKAALNLNAINIAFGHCIDSEISFDCDKTGRLLDTINRLL